MIKATGGRQRAGTAMVLASATGFGTLAILAKLGYATGLGPEQARAFRFLSALQVLGGLLVLLAVVVVQSAQLWSPGGVRPSTDEPVSATDANQHAHG